MRCPSTIGESRYVRRDYRRFALKPDATDHPRPWRVRKLPPFRLPVGVSKHRGKRNGFLFLAGLIIFLSRRVTRTHYTDATTQGCVC